MNNGGDVLARGAKSAQFGTADVSEFEYDLAMKIETVGEKYGLSPTEIDNYLAARAQGDRIDLKPVGSLEDSVTVIDRRHNFMGIETEVKPVEKKERKYPEKTYSQPTTILDRVLVMRVPEDANFEKLEDGSMRDRRSGLIITAAYRQHNNIGIVLATGQFVVLGGLKIPMEDVVRVGDRVKFGDYNSEVFVLSEEKTRELCDAVQMDYEADPEGLRVVRVQDIRTVERPQ